MPKYSRRAMLARLNDILAQLTPGAISRVLAFAERELARQADLE